MAAATSSSSSSEDIASLEAQLALSRAALADRIFAKFGQSSSSSSSQPASSSSSSSSPTSGVSRKTGGQQQANGSQRGAASSTSSPLGSFKNGEGAAGFKHRPPTLGLGAVPANAEQARVSKLSVEDARLRGRLVGHNKPGKSSMLANSGKGAGKRKASDAALGSDDAVDGANGDEDESEDDDEDDVRKGASKTGSGKGIAGSVASNGSKTKSDPFATKAQNKIKSKAGVAMTASAASASAVKSAKGQDANTSTLSTPAKAAMVEGDDDDTVGERITPSKNAGVGANQSSKNTQASQGAITAAAEGSEKGLSKTQRKKLNKRRRLEEEQQKQQQSGTSGSTEVTSATSSGALEGAGLIATQPSDDSSSSFDRPSQPQAGGYQRAAQLPTSEAEPSANNGGGKSGGGLSGHQAALRSKLQGSHFRMLNESLYTSASSDSFRLAQEDPSRMQSYHDGFREQAKKWPQKPYELIGNLIVDGVLADWARLQGGGAPATSAGSTPNVASGKAKNKQQGKTTSSLSSSSSVAVPVGCLVADLGAGEGFLTRYLDEHAKLRSSSSSVSTSLPAGLRPRVLAYDLLDTADGIVRGADCAQSGGVPLPGRLTGTSTADTAGVVDVAVFCLSLMGTDWVGMIREARRILRNETGQLIVAEVSSRMTEGVDAFSRVVERAGFRRSKTGADADVKVVSGGAGGSGKGANAGENTHFVVLRFDVAPVKVGSSDDDDDDDDDDVDMDAEEATKSPSAKSWEALFEQGRKVLQPCLYKRR